MAAEIQYVLRRNLAQAIRRDQLEEADGILTQLKTVDPLSRETRELELEYYLKARLLDQAETLAAQLVAVFPDSARIFQLAGKVAYGRKDYEAAEQRFEESYRLEPNWWTRLFLGKTLTQSGKFDAAEPHLLAVAEQHPQALLDLAWLYERKGNQWLALRYVERFLEDHPGHELAESQRLRLRAAQLAPAELADDVQRLLDLGDDLSPELVCAYCEALFKTGQSGRARDFIAERRNTFDARLATSVAWTAYHHHAYDVAMDLFIATFPRNRTNAKFLTALELAADRCHRLEELIAQYERHAAQQKTLYGRIKTLRRRAGDGTG